MAMQKVSEIVTDQNLKIEELNRTIATIQKCHRNIAAGDLANFLADSIFEPGAGTPAAIIGRPSGSQPAEQRAAKLAPAVPKDSGATSSNAVSIDYVERAQPPPTALDGQIVCGYCDEGVRSLLR